MFNTLLLKQAKVVATKHGLQAATSFLLKELGINSIICNGKLPASGPLLIISNHPGVFDSLLLLNKVKRNDFHFIGLSTYRIFGPKIEEKLLPIYRPRKLNHKLFEYPLCLQLKAKPPENLSIEEIQVRNRVTISQAATLINQGKAVSVFPEGTVGKALKDTKWKSGVGFLVRQINNPKTKVIFVRIQGTRKSDILAFLKPWLRKLLFQPQALSIEFSRPRLLFDLVNKNEDGKTIARRLEALYNRHYG